MGGTAWCCLFIIAKNTQISAASQLGARLGLAWGGSSHPPLGVLLTPHLGVCVAQSSAGRGFRDACRQANVPAPGILPVTAVQGDLVAMTSCTSVIWEKRPRQQLLVMGEKQPVQRAHPYIPCQPCSHVAARTRCSPAHAELLTCITFQCYIPKACCLAPAPPELRAPQAPTHRGAQPWCWSLTVL